MRSGTAMSTTENEATHELTADMNHCYLFMLTSSVVPLISTFCIEYRSIHGGQPRSGPMVSLVCLMPLITIGISIPILQSSCF